MFNSGGTRSHYFSLESILVTQERVPCVFQQTIKQAGKTFELFFSLSKNFIKSKDLHSSCFSKL